MRVFMKALTVGAVALAGSIATAPAYATVISGGTASLSATLTDYNTPLVGTLSKFDTTLGTLNSITFTYSYGFASTITVVAQTDSSGSIRTESAASFSSGDAAIKTVLNANINTTSAIIGSNTLNPAAYDLLGTTRTYSVTAGQSQNYVSNVGVNTQNVTTTAAADLLPFEAAGGGTFVVTAQTLTATVAVNSGGNNTSSQQTFADQSFSISYDYTPTPTVPVPEPVSLSLFGAGLLGLSAAVRRRRS